MKWIGERISFVEHENKTTIIITPEKVGYIRPMMMAWFFMFSTIGAVLLWYYLNFPTTKQEQIILFVFAGFWSYFFFRIGKALSWLMWGKEAIKVDKIAFSLKRSIKGFGKSKEYFLENISKINLNVPEKKSFQAAYESTPWIRGGERIEFEYLGKRVNFGPKLNEQDAKLLFKLITNLIETNLKKKQKGA